MASKKETEQILKILNKIWPFLNQVLSLEGAQSKIDK